MKTCVRKPSDRPGRFRPLLWAVLLTMLAGCGLLGTSTRPVDVLADELVARLRQNETVIQRFAGRGGVRIQDKSGPHYFDMMVAVARPNKLRLVGYDPMGRPALTMTVDGREARILDHTQKSLRVGPASARNLDRFLPMGLGVSELVSLLSGGPVLGQLRRAKVEGGTELGREIWRLDISQADGKLDQSIWMTPPGNRLHRVEARVPGGAVSHRVEYRDHRDIEGRMIPFVVQMEDLTRGTTLTVTYKEVRINPELAPELFFVPAPPGVIQAPLEPEGDGPA